MVYFILESIIRGSQVMVLEPSYGPGAKVKQKSQRMPCFQSPLLDLGMVPTTVVPPQLAMGN